MGLTPQGFVCQGQKSIMESQEAESMSQDMAKDHIPLKSHPQ